MIHKKDNKQIELHGLLYAINCYHTQHLLRIYKRFDRDLDLCLVLAEISRYNTSTLITDKATKFTSREHVVKVLKGCNAYSISTSTGMAPQTVRRKIKKLLDLGWVEIDKDKLITITANVGIDFMDFQKESLAIFTQLIHDIGNDIKKLHPID